MRDAMFICMFYFYFADVLPAHLVTSWNCNQKEEMVKMHEFLDQLANPPLKRGIRGILGGGTTKLELSELESKSTRRPTKHIISKAVHIDSFDKAI